MLSTQVLARLISTTEQNLRKSAKNAIENNRGTITAKGQQYYVRKNGRAYEFSETPFNEAPADAGASLEGACSSDVKSTKPHQTVKDLFDDSNDKALFENFSPDKRDKAYFRLEVVKGWQKAKREKISQPDYLAEIEDGHGEKVSKAQLSDWQKRFRRMGIIGLIDNRTGQRQQYRLREEHKRLIIRFVRSTRGGIINIREIWREVNRTLYREAGESASILLFDRDPKRYKIIDEGVVRRAVETFMRDNPVESMQLTRGYDRTKGAFDSAYGSMEYAEYRCEEFQQDMTPANFMVIDPATGKTYRPKINFVIDTFSRRAVVHLSRTAASNDAMLALIKAVRKLGKPERLRTDNGADYISRHMEETLIHYDIQHYRTGVGSGRENGFVERLNQIQDKQLKFIDNYLGRNVAERTVQEQQTPKKDRLQGKAKPTHQDVTLTPKEAQEFMDKLIDLYENTLHSGLETSPLQKYNADTTPVTYLSAEEIAVFAGKREVRTYGKKGVRCNNTYFRNIQMHNELVGHKVATYTNVFNPDELHLFDIDTGEFLAVAYNEAADEHSPAEYREVNRKFDKKLRENKKQFDEDAAYTAELVRQNITAAHAEAVKQGLFERPEEEVYRPTFADDLSEKAEQIARAKEDDAMHRDLNHHKGALNIDYSKALKAIKKEYHNDRRAG